MPRPPRAACAALCAVLCAALAAGPLASGCSDSRPALLLTGDAGDGLAVNSAALMVDTPASLALQGALALMDPSFPPVGGGPTVRGSGTATSGQVDVDFGSLYSGGVEVSGVVLRGLAQGTFTRSGQTATVTVTFPTLTGSNDALGASTISGTIAFALTLGTGTATGSMTGQASVVCGEAITYTPNAQASVTVSAGAATFALGGTARSLHSNRGDWTVAFGNLQAALTPTRFVSAGSVQLTRTSPSPAVTVTLVFTAPDRGTVTANGSTSDFDLR